MVEVVQEEAGKERWVHRLRRRRLRLLDPTPKRTLITISHIP